jgi:hypothetical protein
MHHGKVPRARARLASGSDSRFRARRLDHRGGCGQLLAAEFAAEEFCRRRAGSGQADGFSHPPCAQGFERGVEQGTAYAAVAVFDQNARTGDEMDAVRRFRVVGGGGNDAVPVKQE